MSCKLFPMVITDKVQRQYLWRRHEPAPAFDHIANLFAPATVDACYHA